MQELIKKVSAAVGIPDDKAKMAIEVVLAQLKAKLPGPLASQVQSALSGEESGDLAGKVGNVGGKLGL